MTTSSQETGLEAAAQELAAGVVRALEEPGRGFPLGWAVDELGVGAGHSHLGAVRVLGADALAPFVLTGRGPGPDDVAAVRAAVRVFPAPPPAPVPDPLWAARDWALRCTLERFDIDVSQWEGLCAGPLIQDATGSAPWPAWSVSMAQLSSLALPELDGPTRAEALSRRADLARGMVRSMLRRDHLTAARLARWLALDQHAAPEPLLETAITHLGLLSDGRPRTALDLAIARRLMEPRY